MKILKIFVKEVLDYHPPEWVTVISGAFVLITLLLSTYLLTDHLSSYKNPEEQKFLIGVILMVPCYSLESFASLVNPSIGADCEILRDCYESFAVYCFGRHLVACLGGEKRTIEFMNLQGRLSSKAPLLDHGSETGYIKHKFPMNYVLRPWKLGEWFYQVLKFGIVQYVSLHGCGSELHPAWAMHCLVHFYTVTKEELAHINPLAKFLTLNQLFFLTWWQGVAIAIFYALGLFKSPIAQGLQFKSSVQDFIICIEMGIASIVHLHVFPAKPYSLLGDRISGVSFLGDYASVDCPIDPDEVRNSERPIKLKFPLAQDIDAKTGTAVRESVRDVLLGGGGYIVKDVKFTVTQAVEPVEKSITKINEKLHRFLQNMKGHEKEKQQNKDDGGLNSSTQTRRLIRGIDDPLLNGTASDSGARRGKRHQRRRSGGYDSADSSGESSDESYRAYEIRGHRWITKD